MSSIEQRTFDAAYKGLASQGWRQSANANGGCLYRHPIDTESGVVILKCAAGHMIPDDAYDQGMERTRANVQPVRSVIEQAGFDVDFAVLVQKCHDGETYDEATSPQTVYFTAMNPTELKAAFDRFAVQHNLTIPDVVVVHPELVS